MNIKLSRFFLESIFDESDFNTDQLNEISIGLDNNIDVFSYVNPAIPAEEMKTIRYTKQQVKQQKILHLHIK